MWSCSDTARWLCWSNDPNFSQIPFRGLYVSQITVPLQCFCFWFPVLVIQIQISRCKNWQISTLFTLSYRPLFFLGAPLLPLRGALMILSSLLYSSQKENRALNQWQVEWNSFVKYILTQFWGPGGLNLSLRFNLISEPIIAHIVRPHEIVGEDSAL